MHFRDLHSFTDFLRKKQDLKLITEPVKSKLEITEISRRMLESGGPALLFEKVIKDDGTLSPFPVLSNLYASRERIAWGLGLKEASQLRALGELLASVKHPSPPSGIKELLGMFPLVKRITAMPVKNVRSASCQEVIMRDPDLSLFPIQTCWPLDAGPLITWPIVVTRGPGVEKCDNYNLGIYRMQVAGKDKLIMRWLKLRGGSSHYERWKESGSSAPFPAAVVIGAAPNVTLSAVMPLPEGMSEYNFAGLISGKSVELVKCVSIDLKVPAHAEIVIEGEVSLDEYLREGPFGDHTGYYNEVELFPVFKVKAITMRKNPIYLTTYTGKPPDEPSILGEALNELFIPLIKAQFPEIVDFFLPPEGCSYRVALVSIKKSYPGQARRIMMGIWSYLKQFSYTKFIVVVDEDIDIRKNEEVVWAISTRVDPARDSVIVENSSIDYLDFASPISGLGSKMGIDATNKIPPETNRTWGEPIKMSEEVIDRIDTIWEKLLV